jgi:vacuolar-type H+-ATPase subunit F/Vma7
MSHTLHRRGTPGNLEGDYVLFSMSAKGFNSENSKHALREFINIIEPLGWVNMGDMKTGGYYLVGKEAILAGVEDTSIVHGVFDSKDELAKAVKAVREADLGVSVIISGILQNVRDVVLENELTPHTVELSLGIRGKTNRLPEDDLLEITTMCGHGMVSHTFVREMLMDIKKGRRASEEAANYLATPCVCGVFNPRRAQMILDELLDVWCMDEV